MEKGGIRITLDETRPDRRNPPATQEGSLEEKIKDLEKKIDDLEIALAGTMHQVRTPLTRLSLGLPLLELDQDDQSVKALVSAFVQDFNEIRHILDDTFDIAKQQLDIDINTVPDSRLTILENRYEVLQHIRKTTLPLTITRLEELEKSASSIPLDKLRDEESFWPMITQGILDAKSFLKEKDEEIAGQHPEEKKLSLVDAGKLVLGLKYFLDGVREKSGVNVELKLPKEKVELLISSPIQLSYAIVQLVVNAKDANKNTNPEDKIVTVSVGVNDDTISGQPCVLFQVADNGCGMSEEMLGKLFQPRVTSKDVAKGDAENGSGFGLNEIEKFITKNQGRMEAQSVEGKGSVFSIYLPLERRSQNL